MTMNDDLQDLESAEDFLDYLAVRYDPHVVHVNRLHILQRFHDYLSRIALPPDEEGQRAVYRDALTRAYQDFVDSSAQKEKVFKVFRQQGSGTVSVALGSLKKWNKANDSAL